MSARVATLRFVDTTGFTPDVVDALRSVDGVLDVVPCSWGSPPMLVVSTRVNLEQLWRTTLGVWDAEDMPVARLVDFVGDRAALAKVLRPARRIMEELSAEGGVLFDGAYPVRQYKRVFLEMGQQTVGFDARWARWAREAAADVGRRAWPIEVQERPWFDSAIDLSRPPAGLWTGPAPAGRHAPPWIPVAMQLLFDRAKPLIPPPAVPEVTWSPRGDDGRGLIQVSWGDGPLPAEVEEAIGGVTEDRWRSIEVDGHQVTYSVKRGLSYGFQLAVLAERPELFDVSSWFHEIEMTVAEHHLDPRALAAWMGLVKRDHFGGGVHAEAYRDYIDEHRDEIGRLLSG